LYRRLDRNETKKMPNSRGRLYDLANIVNRSQKISSLEHEHNWIRKLNGKIRSTCHALHLKLINNNGWVWTRLGAPITKGIGSLVEIMVRLRGRQQGSLRATGHHTLQCPPRECCKGAASNNDILTSSKWLIIKQALIIIIEPNTVDWKCNRSSLDRAKVARSKTGNEPNLCTGLPPQLH